MNLNNKTILITGGTGSFGKNFTSYLLKNHTNLKKIIVCQNFIKIFPARWLQADFWAQDKSPRRLDAEVGLRRRSGTLPNLSRFRAF